MTGDFVDSADGFGLLVAFRRWRGPDGYVEE